MEHIAPATLAIRIESAGSVPVTHAALAQLEAALAAQPESVELRFARAVLLEELNLLKNARGAYKGVLARDPAHFGALMNLGTMLFLERRLAEARILYTQAVAARPDDASAHVNLANLLTEIDLLAARAAYERALVCDPAHPTANFGLARLLDALGEPEVARRYRERAFAEPIVRTAAATGEGEPIRVLLLVAASGGNLQTTLLLDARVLEVTTLVADSYRDGMTLPRHDIVFNAIGDAERSGDALAIAERIVTASGKPVLNAPHAVRATARANVGRFADLPGVIAPRTQLVPRAEITATGLAARGFAFPLLLRAPGYHMGEYFVRVATADELAPELAAIPGDAVLAIEFLDTRKHPGDDARKYRALFVDRAVYPVHLAVSGRWKIHYFSADMRTNDRHNAEERAYLTDLPAAIGARATAALHAIAARLELDYGGIDFGLDARGNVLLFETNATMAINWPEDDARAAYRRPAIAACVAAMERLFRSRARQ